MEQHVILTFIFEQFNRFWVTDNLLAASEMLQLVEDSLEHTKHYFLPVFEDELSARTILKQTHFAHQFGWGISPIRKQNPNKTIILIANSFNLLR